MSPRIGVGVVSKKILIIFSIIMSLCLIIGGVYLKMKYNEREEQKSIYSKEQQERISLYLKYNTKKPNTIKSVHFTRIEEGEMGDVVIDGYINSNKEESFTAFASPQDNFQFYGDMIRTEGIEKLLKLAHERKNPDEIKHELSKEK